MEWRLYRPGRRSPDGVVIALAGKLCRQGVRCVVVTARVADLDEAMWTFRPEVFLPHGSAADPPAWHGLMPVWLTADVENPNRARMLILCEPDSLPAEEEIARAGFSEVCVVGGPEDGLPAGARCWSAEGSGWREVCRPAAPVAAD